MKLHEIPRHVLSEWTPEMIADRKKWSTAGLVLHTIVVMLVPLLTPFAVYLHVVHKGITGDYHPSLYGGRKEG